MRNTNMRKGFTMIELIFVIVIIGILAAVAIPKLAATRDDAKISNIIANSRTALSDMAAKYTALGRDNYSKAEVQAVTNVPFDAACETLATGSTAMGASTFRLCDQATECISFITDANATQVSITRTDSTNQVSPVCAGVYDDPAIIAMTGSDGTKVHIFGGSTVKR